MPEMTEGSSRREIDTGMAADPSILQNGDELRSLGRDNGPISARNSSKGTLLPEAHAVFRALASGESPAELRTGCLTGRLIRQSARESRRRIWQSLDWRYFAWDPPPWILADLGESAKLDVTDRRFVGLAYVHYARRDRLTFDFVTDRLWSLSKGGAREVRRSDVMDFLAEIGDGTSARWRQSTRTKLAGNVLSALRNFGLLTGVQRKRLQRPVVAPEVALHS